MKMTALRKLVSSFESLPAFGAHPNRVRFTSAAFSESVCVAFLFIFVHCDTFQS